MKEYKIESTITGVGYFTSRSKVARKLNTSVTEIVERHALDGYKLVSSDSTAIGIDTQSIITTLYFEKEKDVVSFIDNK